LDVTQRRMPVVILSHLGQFDVIIYVSYPGSVPCMMDLDQHSGHLEGSSDHARQVDLVGQQQSNWNLEPLGDDLSSVLIHVRHSST